MMEGQFAQNTLAPRGNCQADDAAIFPAANPMNQATIFEPVSQFDGAMVPELEPLGEMTNRCHRVSRQAFQSEEQLMLLGLEPRAPGRPLAQAQKTSNPVAKLRQCLVIGVLHREYRISNIYRFTT